MGVEVREEEDEDGRQMATPSAADGGLPGDSLEPLEAQPRPALGLEPGAWKGHLRPDRGRAVFARHLRAAWHAGPPHGVPVASKRQPVPRFNLTIIIAFPLLHSFPPSQGNEQRAADVPREALGESQWNCAWTRIL
jgi:hypothetical protein